MSKPSVGPDFPESSYVGLHRSPEITFHLLKANLITDPPKFNIGQIANCCSGINISLIENLSAGYTSNSVYMRKRNQNSLVSWYINPSYTSHKFSVLPLSLFMFWITTNNHHPAAPPNNATSIASRFD